MRRKAGGLIAVVLLVGAAAALASTKSVSDTKGDSRPHFPDIRSATVKTTARRITATIVAYGPFAKKASPCFSMTTNLQRTNGDGFVVCGDGKIQNFTRGNVAGTAKLEHPNATTAVYLIGRGQIGNPGSFTWLAEVRGLNDACIMKYHDICDVAPNKLRRVKQTF